MLFGENGLISRAQNATESWNQAQQNESEGLNSLYDEMENIINGTGGNETLSSDGSWSDEKGINTPDLEDDMTAVKWDDTGNEITTTGDDTDWYNYDNNEWANAMTADGSYWVWIPRYEYKIDYTTNGVVQGTNTDYTKAGTIEVNFIGKDATASSGYIVHPAFTTDIVNGGWSSNLAGIWVAKYEMSREDSTDSGATWSQTTTTGNVATKNAGSSSYIRAVSKPGVSSWRTINIANCYENSHNYDRAKESHLMKNSEWGAVAYLTHSKYGRNGTEVTINNNGTTYYTGGGAGTAYTTNTNQSSTGNVTGIYDLSGNAYEYVAGFNSAYNSTYYGSSYYSEYNGIFASYGGTSTKYATAYSNSSSTYYATAYSDFTNGRDVSHIGDGIHEVWVSTYRGWFSDYSYFVGSDYPFFLRGGIYDDGVGAGVFYSDGNYRLC